MQLRDDGSKCKGIGIQFKAMPKGIQYEPGFEFNVNSPLFEELMELNSYYGGGPELSGGFAEARSEEVLDGNKVFAVNSFDFLVLDLSKVDWERARACQLIMILDRQCFYRDQWTLYIFLLKYGSILVLVLSLIQNLQREGREEVDRTYKLRHGVIVAAEILDILLDLVFLLTTRMDRIFSMFLLLALVCCHIWYTLVQKSQLAEDPEYQKLSGLKRMRAFLMHKFHIDVFFRETHDPDERVPQHAIMAVLQNLVNLKVFHDTIAWQARTMKPY